MNFEKNAYQTLIQAPKIIMAPKLQYLVLREARENQVSPSGMRSQKSHARTSLRGHTRWQPISN